MNWMTKSRGKIDNSDFQQIRRTKYKSTVNQLTRSWARVLLRVTLWTVGSAPDAAQFTSWKECLLFNISELSLFQSFPLHCPIFTLTKSLEKPDFFYFFLTGSLLVVYQTDSENRNRVGGLGLDRLTPVLTTQGSKCLITISAFGIRSFTHKNFLTLKNQCYFKCISETVFDMTRIIYIWARNF